MADWGVCRTVRDILERVPSPPVGVQLLSCQPGFLMGELSLSFPCARGQCHQDRVVFVLLGFVSQWKMIIEPLSTSESNMHCSPPVLVLLAKDHDMYGKELLETSVNFTEP